MSIYTVNYNWGLIHPQYRAWYQNPVVTRVILISTSYTELSSRTAKNRDKCGITWDPFFPMFENVSRCLGAIWYAMQRWYDKWWSKWHEEWWMGRMWGSAPGVEAPHCDDGVSLAIMTPQNFTLYTESDLFLQQAHNQRFRIIALPLDLSGSQVWVCPPTYLQFEMHEIFTYPRLWRCCWHGWTDQRD